MKKKKKKTKKKNNKIRKKIVTLIVLILVAIIGFCGFEIYNGYNTYKEALSSKNLKERVQEIEENENYTKIEELPKIYINAVIAVEDHRFYEHKGVDIISIGRAIITDIKTMSLAEGGSTITQQLAKNTYFTQKKKLNRKVAEIFMAIEIEKNYSKDEILEFYINTCYFGDGYYSLKEASRGYFNKEPIEMNDYESIMLAGIPNAPSVYAPTKNLKLAKQRQKQVADAMVKYKYLTKDEADKILNSQ